jgi:hypothetical protein
LSIIDFFGGGTSYSKKDFVQLNFIEDLVLHVCKGYQSISIVESSWLRRLVMKRNPKVKFPTRIQFVSKHLPNMVAKTVDRYMLFLLTKCEMQVSLSIFGCLEFSMIHSS